MSSPCGECALWAAQYLLTVGTVLLITLPWPLSSQQGPRPIDRVAADRGHQQLPNEPKIVEAEGSGGATVTVARRAVAEESGGATVTWLG